MKHINLITLLSLGSALACLVFIFVYFRMPSVIMSTNSIIISEQDQEILKKSSIIEDLDLSIKTGSDTILSLNNEVEKLETQLFDLNENIEEKIEEIKILNDDLVTKNEEFQKVVQEIEKTDEQLSELNDNSVELNKNNTTVKSIEIKVQELESNLLEKDEKLLLLVGENKQLGKEMTQLKSELGNNVSSLKSANNQIEELKEKLDTANSKIEELKEKVKKSNSVSNRDVSQVIESVNNQKDNFQGLTSLDGLVVSLEGFLTYDDNKNVINFMTRNGVILPLKQDEFAGALVGSCGLPISNSMEERCLAKIEAEIVEDEGRLVLVGREIIDITN